MKDRYSEFLRILGKMLQHSQMTLTEAEKELIKEYLLQILDNNPNFGTQTKQVFKSMVNKEKNPMDLAVEVETYIVTHDVSQ